MPRLSARHHSRPVSRQADESPAAGSIKRPRHLRTQVDENEDEGEGDGDGEVEGEEEQDGEEVDADGDVDVGAKEENNVTHNGPSPSSGFEPGAIVRVVVKNFVTYTHAEFRPGPNLNMVIGPNGTGKSSLVCAICLGLGYSPKHLGRASHVGEFVKHGADIATVEIELQKRSKDPKNWVVRLRILKESGSRKFSLNGHDCTHEKIKQLMHKFRIQIDNLCQFLPQDKVAEFAGLTPIQLLHETLRAAAPGEMSKWQDQLKEHHSDFKTQKQQLTSTEETLRNLEARQQGLQSDVDRLRELDTIKERIEDLTVARTCAEYQECKDRMSRSKEIRKKAENRLRELEKAAGPAIEAINHKQAYHGEIDTVIKFRKKALTEAETAADQGFRAVEDFNDKINEVKGRIEAEIQANSDKTNQFAQMRQKLIDMEAKRDRASQTEFDAHSWNQKIREKQDQRFAKDEEIRDVGQRLKEINRRYEDVITQGREVVANIRQLESQAGQQMAMLRNVLPDAATAWAWILEHQNDFEKDILGPPMLTCKPKDMRYSDMIQNLLNRWDMTCFIAQTQSDHKKLSNHLYDTMKLSVNIRLSTRDISEFRPPIPREDAHDLGLDGFAIDFLDGPAPVLANFCEVQRLHVNGVALQDISTEQYDKLLQRDTIGGWASGKISHRVTRRREYGPGAVTVGSKPIAKGKFWNDQPVDTSEKEALEKKKRELAAFKEEVKQERIKADLQSTQLQQMCHDLRQEEDHLKHQKSELQKEHTERMNLPTKIQHQKDNLEVAQTALQNFRARVRDMEAEIENIHIEKVKGVLRYKDIVSHIRTARDQLLEAQVRFIEANSDLEGLKHRNSGIIETLGSTKAQIDEAKSQINSHKKRGNELMQALIPHGEELGRFRELSEGKTVDEISTEISGEEAKLEVLQGVDPSILRQFEKRAKDIEEKQQSRDALAIKVEIMEASIQNIMEQFEPNLDDVISRINDAFSYNFEQINCAGEVSVHKDEDFEQWAIQVKVKFRPNETLQLLNQHRQSGGERAVSTIFYLMALQSMAQAPFRVVDEINQGMDPRNERMVHERMVDIACHEHTSQYFLITPKLLTGLKYARGMRVLCIASGEYVPEAEEGRTVNFKKQIQAALKLKQKRAEGM